MSIRTQFKNDPRKDVPCTHSHIDLRTYRRYVIYERMPILPYIADIVKENLQVYYH